MEETACVCGTPVLELMDTGLRAGLIAPQRDEVVKSVSVMRVRKDAVA